MTKGLRAQESTLADIFRPGIEMAMPPYQRSYSWDKEEVLDLFNDLTEASEGKSAHFIGAIVLVREENGRLLIVDGQQRLTTLTILLAVLRDIETDAKRSAHLNALICDDQKSLLAQGIVWRISLNHIDGAFFRETVQKSGATRAALAEPSDSESQQRMVANTNILRDAVKSLTATQRANLTQTLHERLLLVQVIVEDWDDGYNVFRVLNTRGKAPNSHDIIKTDLLERSNLSSVDAALYSRQWAEHEAALGGSGFDDLLNQIRVLYSRNSASGPTGFRKAVLNRTDAVAFLSQELPAYVDAYILIAKAEPKFTAHNQAIKVALNHLRLIDHQLWRAPALRFLVTHKGDPDEGLAFFTQLERFAFAMMLVVTDRNQRLKRYGKIADACGTANLLHERGPLALSRDECHKMRARLTGRFGSFGQRRAIALRLNAAIAGGVPLGPDDGATVEHVLPRNLPDDSPWHNSWPNPAQHRDLCETIGNFVLLTEAVNQKADTGSFTEKKALYFAEGQPEYALTQDLRTMVAWTPEIVRRRTADLAEILASGWNLE